MASSWTADQKGFCNEHSRWLNAAGKASPNPLVLRTCQDGQVIAEGWHDHLGGLHAEQMAITMQKRMDILRTVLPHTPLWNRAIWTHSALY